MGAKTKLSNKASVVKKNSMVKNPTPSKIAKFAKTGLDSSLVGKAVNAVLNYHIKVTNRRSDKLELLGDDRPVQVQLTLLRAPGKSQPKPAQLLIPHPFYKFVDTTDDNSDDLEEPEICLIVKDESKPWCLKMIEKFPDQMGYVKKVLTLDSLRKKHQSYEQKRQLLSKYNMFMVDDRILPMISKAIGKAFIKVKKIPIPVDVTRETSLPFVILKALSATYMTVNTGTCISIRAGHTGMAVDKLAANIIAISKAAATKIPNSWANIQMICVKTADSASLPVYNKTPEALREIAKLAGVNTDEGLSSEENVEKEKGSLSNNKNGEEKKKKNLKSPLLRALKKQKKADEEKQASNKTKSEKKRDSNLTPEKKAKRSPSPQPTSSTKKKQKIEESLEKNKEKKDFIAAKKFKGSRNGYAFKIGPKGLGYYVDKVPVVDKMAIEAILRIGGEQGRASRKKGKQRGRRR